MIGLVITTYNRPEYLRQCFDSLSKCKHDVHIVIVDDCSKDIETVKLIKDFAKKHNAKTIFKQQNKGIADSLTIGFDYLVSIGCTKLMNLDGDAIVARNFFEKVIDLHNQLGCIVTGFNTLSKSRNNRIRHPILRKYKEYCKKQSIGGINMVFSAELYRKNIREILQRPGHWDWNLIRAFSIRMNYYCTVPSVVQHIGINSSLGNNDGCDIAHDFMEKPPTKVILQHFGLGDIIFCQQIANKLMIEGHEVLWPVLPQYYDQVKDAYPNINFCKDSPIDNGIQEFRIVGNYEAIPLRWSDIYMKVKFRWVMKAKYDMMGMDYRDWHKGAYYVRDLEKEKRLAEIVGANGEYTLINRNFLAENRKINIPKITGKVIEMDLIPGYSLFDWSTVIENASAIHTVSTSIMYILDILQLKCRPYVYKRIPVENDHNYYNYLFKKDYIYV